MSRSKHTEAQIIAALKQVEAGRRAEDVAREQGVSKHTIYAWKAKYGGMEVSEAEEVKHLRDENARLRKLIGDPKKLIGLVERKAEVRRLRVEFSASERRVCGLMGVPRTSFRYQSCRDDSDLRGGCRRGREKSRAMAT